MTEDDRSIAKRWLANQRKLRSATRIADRLEIPPDFELDVYDSLLDLLLDDEETARAWNLAMTLLDLVTDDQDLEAVGVYVLEPLLRKHGEELLIQVAARMKVDPRLRQALSQIYLHGRVAELVAQRKTK